MARTKSDNLFLAFVIAIIISMGIYLFGFLVPEVRNEILVYKNKCKEAGGEIVNINSEGRRCIKPDSFIEIE